MTCALKRPPSPGGAQVYTMIGGSLLWVGWFGFNAGSALAADGRAGFAMLTTQVRIPPPSPS